ncbi:hypothetical protein [Pararobbsia alpina]|uniref:hypothetical protein n=1 Tax=Pararobbsia alpina TaxID=621374 RepID=UPI001581AE7F|nr:hypothetical protein [Pararobbsia alpina]
MRSSIAASEAIKPGISTGTLYFLLQVPRLIAARWVAFLFDGHSASHVGCFCQTLERELLRVGQHYIDGLALNLSRSSDQVPEAALADADAIRNPLLRLADALIQRADVFRVFPVFCGVRDH